MPHRFAIAHGQLAPHQVNGLDAVGAFIDRGDAGVAIVLGRAGFFNKAHATVDLKPHRGNLDADIGGPGLGHGHEQLFAQASGLAQGRVDVELCHVGGDAGGQADGTGGLDAGLHQHQHAPNIGMVEDAGRMFAGPGRAALLALHRIG